MVYTAGFHILFVARGDIELSVLQTMARIEEDEETNRKTETLQIKDDASKSVCPFHVLGIPTTAKKDEINRAWRQLTKDARSDKDPSQQATENVSLNDARDRAMKICITRAMEDRTRRDEADRQRWDEEARLRKEGDDRYHKAAEEKKRKDEEDKKRTKKTIQSFIKKVQKNASRKGHEAQREFQGIIAEINRKNTVFLLSGFDEYETLYAMAKEIHKHVDSAVRLNTKLEETTATLESERLAKETDTTAESCAKDAQEELAEAGGKQEIESQTEDNVAQQQLAEMTAKLAEMTAKYESECQAKDASDKKLEETAATLESERRAKEEALKQLAEMTTQMEGERLAKDNAVKQLMDMSAKDDTQLAESTNKLEAETSTKDNTTQQLAGSKRKRDSPETKNVLQANITDFVQKRLFFKAGHKINTKCIQDAFFEEYKVDSTMLPDISFQKMLKACVDAKFQDTSVVFPTRSMQAAERARGYVGIALH